MSRCARLASAVLLLAGLADSLPAQQTWGRWTPGAANFGDWRWAAPVANVAALPASASAGTCRWATAEAAIYCWTGAAWVEASGGGADDDVPEVGDFGALNPAACPADQWVTDITAGALVCAQPAFSNLSGAVTDLQVPNTITIDLAAAATVLAADPANCGAGEWAAGVAASGAAQGCTADDDVPESGDFAAATDLTAAGAVATNSVALGTDTTGGYAGSATEGGPATTAEALAANGANCAAGSWAAGVDAAGAAEGCTADDDQPDSDAEVPDAITVDGYALLSGATFTGVVGVDNAQGFRLFEGDAGGSNYVEFVAPATLGANRQCVLEDDGNPIPDSCVGDGTDGGGALPAGSGSELQYRADGSTFGAVTGSSVSGANVTLGGTLGGITQLDVDNLRIDGNTISATDTNGNVDLAPPGSGIVRVRIAGSSSDYTLRGNGASAGIALGSNFTRIKGGSSAANIILDSNGVQFDRTVFFSYLAKITAKTSAYTVNPIGNGETGATMVFTNEGAAGSVTFTLPSAATGYDLTFYVQAAQNVVIQAATGDTIRIAGGVSSAAGTATNGTVGGVLRIVAINATEWVALFYIGTWTLA